MLRWFSILVLLTAVAVRPAQAQSSSKGSGEGDKGTYLGVLFSAVPQAVYAQVPVLPHDNGVLVNFVLPGSPAAVAGLQRYDVLLQYDSTQIKDCDHFAELIRNDNPDHTLKLTYLRGGNEQTAQASLDLGPAL